MELANSLYYNSIGEDGSRKNSSFISRSNFGGDKSFFKRNPVPKFGALKDMSNILMNSALGGNLSFAANSEAPDTLRLDHSVAIDERDELEDEI